MSRQQDSPPRFKPREKTNNHQNKKRYSNNKTNTRSYSPKNYNTPTKFTFDNKKEEKEKEKDNDDNKKQIILKNLSTTERREFREAFRLFDKDDDGTITIDELQEVFIGLNYHFTKKQLEKMVGTIDIDGDGEINLEEFILMMKGKNYGDPKNKHSYLQELREAFDVFDKDGDGNITPQELAHCLKALGENLDNKDIMQMMSEADEDGDNTIDFEEFKKLMNYNNVLFKMKKR